MLIRSEDVVNYSITAIVCNAGRRADALDEFDVWAPGLGCSKAG